MKHSISIVLLACACSEPPGPIRALDAGAGDAADCQLRRCLDLDAGDAGGDDAGDAGGLPLGESCDLLQDACGAGLGCRLDGQGFRCQPAGTLGQGADCAAAGTPSCAPGLACFAGDRGELTCRRWCDAGQADACGPGLTCYPRSLPPPYPATAGACG